MNGTLIKRKGDAPLKTSVEKIDRRGMAKVRPKKLRGTTLRRYICESRAITRFGDLLFVKR